MAQVGIHWTGDNPQQVSAVAVGSSLVDGKGLKGPSQNGA